ncbi:MAG: copper resistance protein B [Acidobacteria bacterium]|nr:copper resistance protein B [Acidobacteriota bacterium]
MGRITSVLAAVGLCLVGASGAAAQTPPPPPPPPPPPVEDHSAHMAQATKAADPSEPKEPIPALTDADRAAAFPAGLDGHAMGSDGITFMVLFDQAEWRGTGDGGAAWDNRTWIGGDINRLWLRSEGEADNERVENAFATALVGHSFARWWDVVAGVRQDFRPGSAQTWVAFGIQGLAPYWFEVEATGYVGASGRTHMRLEVEYELLITNRLILQPLIEAEVYGKSDPARDIGAGLTSIETGLRLRYEIRREFAPYLGVTWGRKFFGTADRARAAGQDVSGGRVVFGLRTWF